MSWPDENARGTQASGGDAGHGGAHAELARLVAGRANHAPLGGRAADDDRLAAQPGMVPLLHGCVERIHVDQANDSEHLFAKSTIPRRNSVETQLLRRSGNHPPHTAACKQNGCCGLANLPGRIGARIPKSQQPLPSYKTIRTRQESCSAIGVTLRRESSGIRAGLRLPLPSTSSLSHMSSGKLTTAQTPAALSWPPQIKFIIGNEACERFSYYGIRSILALYISTVLFKHLPAGRGQGQSDGNHPPFYLRQLFHAAARGVAERQALGPVLHDPLCFADLLPGQSDPGDWRRFRCGDSISGLV